jgi:hypothetical protein
MSEGQSGSDEAILQQVPASAISEGSIDSD